MAVKPTKLEHLLNESEAELDAFAAKVQADESLQIRLSEARTSDDVKVITKDIGFDFDVISMAGKVMISS
ncbi:MAG: Nif11-like leader peptide family natural product precursor, partial [Cyanobacteria bacterium P01_H01_bin.121]